MDRPAAVRLAFVNASEAGVPDQPMASCYLSRALVRIARRRACVRSSLLGQVDVRDQLDVAAPDVSGVFFPYRQRSRSLGGSELVGQNSGRERNSLIRAEIS